MTQNGKHKGDGIGAIYKNLSDILKPLSKKQRTRIKDLNPNANFNKNSNRFLHDLIYFTSPISTKQLFNVIQFIFDSFEPKILYNHLKGF